MEIPFIGGAYQGRSTSFNAQQSINCFPAYDKNQPKTAVAMYGTPGTLEFSDTEYGAYEVRGMVGLGSYFIAVVGARIFKVASNGTATAIDTGEDLSTSSGYVGMASNGVHVLIVDGTTDAKIVTDTTITNIDETDDYPQSDDCTFFDGYFLVHEVNTGRFYLSGLYDGTTWNPLDFATAESSPDNLIGLGSTKQNIWLFGIKTVEVYFNSGNADFPFERVPGAINDIGCNAVGSICNAKGVLFWLTSNNTIARSNGYAYEEISTESINYQISTYATVNNARGFYYEVEGEVYYAINFPTPQKTWVVNIRTNDWFEWQTDDDQFRGICSIQWFDKMLIGDRSDSRIFQLSMNTYTDDGEPIKRVRRAQYISKERFNILHHRLELDFEFGVGLNVAEEADGYDPQAVLRWSDDGGNTWSSSYSVSIGKYQEYTSRAIWRRLGKSRNRIYELTVDEPVKFVLIGAYSNLISCKV